ncbi:MAG: methyltransferase domain-containing protein [Pseudomonadales bacterium]|jgi:SAM-dependent methyltransferase|nr:hypothetical protein [Gammaproteobacteria bacterium]MDP7313559.1 methyltransferase domain-containing protein [Pseudomonadales bacterium]MDP7576006.1 methyltransferase domain-containing protein [Pseudomonadales bacterium]|tara:strand:+ start:29684 stop:30439 length:756 start_codon:yes stop_codon:yes gene_type:complete
MIANLFVHQSAAQRYASARPYFHQLVTEAISAFTRVSEFSCALDVGCGTGQSARALTDIAETVNAIDISPEMIGETEHHNRVHYQVASAENMPFEDDSFQLLTAGLAFHWFDQSAFLTEARRVLQSGGWLVVYNSFFKGKMIENDSFKEWALGVYPQRFPKPPRHAEGIRDENIDPFGFKLKGHEKFTHDEVMSVAQLVEYLLTHTNVIAMVESGSTPLDDAASWITSSVTPFFKAERGTMQFGGDIWYLR